jgi:hypothetical protein
MTSSATAGKRTLDTQHNLQLTRFRELQASRNMKLAQLQAVNEGIAAMSSEDRRSRYEDYIACVDRRAALECELRAIQCCRDEVKYYTHTADVIFRYYDVVDNNQSSSGCATAAHTRASRQPHGGAKSILHFFKTQSDTPPPTPSSHQMNDVPRHTHRTDTTAAAAQHPTPTQQDRASLLNRYLTYMATTAAGTVAQTDLSNSAALPTGSSASAAAAAAAAGTGACPHCGSQSRSVVITEGMVYCNQCATIEYVVVDHDKPSFKEPPKEISYFAYKRINHFNEWLNQIQGKETTDIPEEVYDKILMEIQKERITNMADVGPAKLKDILRRLRLNKYYEHSSYIITKLNGATMPHMPPELEDQLRNMFRQVQVPFLRHAPSKRRNFLSYAFCIYKFLQLLERDEYLQYFPLLKSREKLQVQDNIFKKICEDLNWHFIKSL